MSPTPKANFWRDLAGSAGEWVLPIAAVSVVFVMLVPMPALLLDLLLALSITASVLVLLSAVHILRPVQFSVFPSLLLLLTLFRLSLNLASSRRILLHGNEGASAAGQVIEAFGQFVVGGNYVVGFVLFLALIAIQYMVVSHGAVRTAEVTARFTLDAMPGKQMAIDADLNAGLIDEHQARKRREQVSRESEFYGAMDGAARFNQRDAMATILITAINIIAGFLIGVFQLDIPFREALKTYTILTVGDGLVTMIPSLLVSVSGGMVLTRASSESSLSGDLRQQLFGNRRTLWITAAVLVALALVPGLPKISFLSAAAGLGWLARRATSHAPKSDTPPAADSKPGIPGDAVSTESLDALLKLDDLSIEIGHALVPMVDTAQQGQLLSRIRSVRKHLSVQFGFIVPPVHITDNLRLKPREYVVQLRGVEVARWETKDDCLLAISSEENPAPLPGIDTVDPAFGAGAKWIVQPLREQALALGYAVVDQTSVIATHLAEVVRSHAYELLSRSETKRLLDKVGEAQPKLVEELVPKLLSLGEVQRVLQQLLREQVSIRDLTTVLETLIETACVTKNTVVLVEAVRQALSRALVRPLLGDDGALRVITLDGQMEDELSRAFCGEGSPNAAALAAPFLRRVLEGLRKLVGQSAPAAAPVLLCPTPARYHLRRMLEPFLPKVVVLSPIEIPPSVTVSSIAMVR